MKRNSAVARERAIGDARDTAPWCPDDVRALALAILEDAVGLIQGTIAGDAEERVAAREWMVSRGIGPFSFRHLCEMLGLEPEAVRVGVVGRAPRLRLVSPPRA